MSLISTMRKFLILVKGVTIKKMMQCDGQVNDKRVIIKTVMKRMIVKNL